MHRRCVTMHVAMQVKHRMRNREQYQDFLKCLSLFSEDIISKGELLNLVADSLSRHPDLAVQYSFQNLQHCWTLAAAAVAHYRVMATWFWE